MKFSFKKKEKKKIDYLSMTTKEKFKQTVFVSLKWGGPIILVEVLLLFILDYSLLGQLTGTTFFVLSLMGIPGLLLFIGGCIGGLSRYNIPPKLRIIEPDDQAVTPASFQIRVRYDLNSIDPKSIKILVNEKAIPTKINEETNIVYVPRVFKSPPKRAIALTLSVEGNDVDNKLVKDGIRIICDPEADEEDYLEYWEFKREDQTYWGKEMEAAQKHARRILMSFYFFGIALLLLAFNAIFGWIYWNFIGPIIF